MLLDAEYQWDAMDVPMNRIVSSAFTCSNTVVVDEEEIERASHAKVARLFKPILPLGQSTSYHMASRHAFTLCVEWLLPLLT